eukprot:SAG31_NODE_12096_length_968_cov_4.445339_1_plen_85_part_01
MGDHFDFVLLREFISAWVTLHGLHAGSRALWQSLIGESAKRDSKTRWYAKAEIAIQISKFFNKLDEYIHICDERDYGDATRSRLK